MYFHKRERRWGRSVSADSLRIADLMLLVALQKNNGNLTDAAKELGVSQPAVTKQLRAIQLRLKVTLVECENGHAKFTAAGLSLLPGANDCIAAFHRCTQDARHAHESGPYKLRIGASCFLAHRWVTLLQSVELPLFRDLEIQVDTAYTERLLHQLERRDLDLALVTSPPQSAWLTSHCVARSEFRIAFREKHPLAAMTTVSLGEVVAHPWVFFHASVHPWLHDLILGRAEQVGGARVLHHVSQVDHVPPLLNNDGRLIAWLTPDGAAHIERNGLVSRPLVDSEIRIETHIATRSNDKSRLVSEFARNFVKLVEGGRSPVQLTLPMAWVMTSQDGTEVERVLRRSA